MTHRFPIKEIAAQAGLGTATVDRVLNNRAHVSPQTRQRVAAAIEELAGQESQLAARGRRLFFDIVVEAPARFSREVRKATEAVLADIGAAVCRPRFLMQEIMREEELLSALSRIARRGSHGICLKARDLPSVRAAIGDLDRAGIPVVTLVTDIPASDRIAYVGLDNGSAGRTAAYLVGQRIGAGGQGTVLTSKSQTGFIGEEERATAFAAALARSHPGLRLLELSGGSGVPFETSRIVMPALQGLADLRAVYSMGGGNRAILAALAHHNLAPEIYVAHDLDTENRALLEEGRLGFVLDHDLRADMRNALLAFLHHHRLLPADPAVGASRVEVITPANVPPQPGS